MTVPCMLILIPSDLIFMSTSPTLRPRLGTRLNPTQRHHNLGLDPRPTRTLTKAWIHPFKHNLWCHQESLPSYTRVSVSAGSMGLQSREPLASARKASPPAHAAEGMLTSCCWQAQYRPSPLVSGLQCQSSHGPGYASLWGLWYTRLLTSPWCCLILAPSPTYCHHHHSLHWGMVLGTTANRALQGQLGAP